MSPLDRFLESLYDGKMPREVVVGIEAWVLKNREHYESDEAMMLEMRRFILAEMATRPEHQA